MREQGSLSSEAVDHPIQLLFLSQGVSEGWRLVVLEARSSEAAFSSDTGLVMTSASVSPPVKWG